MAKYFYEIQRENGDWIRLFTESRSYCLGYLECASTMPGPRLAARVVSLTGQVIANHAARSDVSLGQIAGFPSAEQYERAAARALERASKIREIASRSGKSR